MLTFVPTSLNPLSFGSLGRTDLDREVEIAELVLIPFHSGLWVERLSWTGLLELVSLNPLSFGSLGRTGPRLQGVQGKG